MLPGLSHPMRICAVSGAIMSGATMSDAIMSGATMSGETKSGAMVSGALMPFRIRLIQMASRAAPEVAIYSASRFERATTDCGLACQDIGPP